MMCVLLIMYSCLKSKYFKILKGPFLIISLHNIWVNMGRIQILGSDQQKKERKKITVNQQSWYR